MLVELAPPGVGVARERLRLELDGALSLPFHWAYVGIDAIAALAATAGLAVGDRWHCEQRWFARASQRPPITPGRARTTYSAAETTNSAAVMSSQRPR